MSDERFREVYQETIDRKVKEMVDLFEISIPHYLSVCESPIEKLFLLGLEGARNNFDVTWEQQRQIGPYRVDFVLRFRDKPISAAWTELVVELDGHDFHERTKAQAKKDKTRDRELLGQGFHVVRFTGSEVYADPFGCAEKAMDLVMSVFYDRHLISYERTEEDGE